VVAVTGFPPDRTSRSAARRALILGAVLAVIGLVVGGRPSITLYDGVVPDEPYLWLDPPPGHPGNPQGATATLPLKDGKSPLVAVATPELVPQAQVFAIPAGLVLTAGTTGIDVSIAPVEPPGLPTDSHIEGNVYAFTVTNQAGTPLTADPAALVSIVLRAPDPATPTATVARWDGTTWEALQTSPAGAGATFSAVVTEFGDFAVLLPGAAASASPGEPTAASPTSLPSESATAAAAAASPGTLFGLDRGTLTLVLGGVAVVIVALVAAIAFLPSRRPPPPPGWGGSSGGGQRSRRRDRR
jgi:hypothetical protein